MTDLSPVQLWLLLFSFRGLSADLTKLIDELDSLLATQRNVISIFKSMTLSEVTSVLFRIHLQSSFCTHLAAKDLRFLHEDSDD